MGCAPSKPAVRRSREPETTFPRYTGPKDFRASVMPERERSRESETTVPRYTGPTEFRASVMPERRSDRQAAQMYQTYQKLDKQRGMRAERRYSWEGHPSEKVLTTFDQLADRGIIPKNALKRK